MKKGCIAGLKLTIEQTNRSNVVGLSTSAGSVQLLSKTQDEYLDFQAIMGLYKARRLFWSRLKRLVGVNSKKSHAVIHYSGFFIILRYGIFTVLLS
ncbi:MAG TPA: hypothetical protein VK017_01360 [Sphingobacterium sp.]|nr:hypothetical protein [Sphingobacterium sp.]